MKLMKMGSVARAAGAFIVTLMIVLTVIACEGPAGPAGETGDPGKDAPVPVVPANTAPVAASATLAAVTLDVGKSITVNVAANFSDPEKATLTFGALSLDATVATAAATGSMVKVTGVAKGDTIVGVTATDPGGLLAAASIPVKVTAPKPAFDPKTNKAPAAVGTIKAQTINVGSKVTMDVADYFKDENVEDGDVLTYTVKSSLERVVSATVAGSEVTVNAVAEGSATVTVTATDLGKMTAMQAFKVTSQAVAKPTTPAPSCGTAGIDVGAKCEVTIGADQELRSADTQKVTVNRKGASTTIWEVVAKAKGSTKVEVVDTADRTVSSSFVVKVNNQTPSLTTAGNVREVYREIEHWDRETIKLTGVSRPTYLIRADLDTYIEDKDDDDALTWNYESSTRAVIILKYNKGTGGVPAGFIVDVTDHVTEFDIIVTGTDDEDATSPSVTLAVADEETGIRPRQWSYQVEQRDEDGAMRLEEISMRRGTSHVLEFMRHPGHDPDNDSYILEFIQDWVTANTTPPANSNLAATPTLTDNDLLELDSVPPTISDPTTTDGPMYLKITTTGPLTLGADPTDTAVGEYAPPTATTPPMLYVNLTGGLGRATIKFELMIWYDSETRADQNGDEILPAWHSRTEETLTVNIVAVTKDG